jgi:hypothetical protein
VGEQAWTSRAAEVVRLRTSNKKVQVSRVEPVRDSEGNLQGYLAFARP